MRRQTIAKLESIVGEVEQSDPDVAVILNVILGCLHNPHPGAIAFIARMADLAVQFARGEISAHEN